LTVVKHHPTIELMPLVDRQPNHNGHTYAWFNMDRERATLHIPESAEIPGILFDLMKHRHHTNNVISFADERYLAWIHHDDALDALARIVVIAAREGFRKQKPVEAVT
jgi:hypothetical protein